MSLNIAQTHEVEASYALFPATACQIRFWHEQNAMPDASALNTAFRLQLTGALEAEAVEEALRRIIARHETLRTGFVMTNEGLRQQVWSHVGFSLDVIEAGGLDEAAIDEQIERSGRREALKPFDLDSRSFFRAVWLPKSAMEGELQVTFHSLVMDGWSWAMFVRELLETLSALSRGREPELAEVELHHGDYALWKEEFIASGALERSRAYWREELSNFSRFDVPTDRPRPAQRRHQGVIRSVLLPATLTDTLAAAAKEQGITLFSMALAALAASLCKSTGQGRIAISTQMSVRDQQELEKVMGPLVNMAVLRLDASRNPTLAELAVQCSAKVSNAITHVHVPFEEMIDMAREVADPSRPPLCAVNFALQRSFIGVSEDMKTSGISAVTPPSFNAGALYDLGFFMVGRAEGWRISCEGDTDLFDTQTIDRHIEEWRKALEALAFKPDQPISRSLGFRPAGEESLKPSAVSHGSGIMSQAELEAAASNVVCFNEDATGTPIVALNNTAVYFGLSQQIGTDHPFIDIPMVPPGEPREFPLRAFEDIAADTARLIRMVRPRGPYILMGLCVLGALGFEVARQLRREGEEVELVILNDSWCPGYRETMPRLDRILRKLNVYLHNIPRDFRKVLRKEKPLVEYLEQYRIVRKLRITRIALKLGLIKGDISDYTKGENRWYMDYLQAQQARYRPPAYDGAVQIFRSRQALKGRLFAYELGWKPVVTGELVVTEVPTMHDEMFRPAGAAVIGAQVRKRLAKPEDGALSGLRETLRQ